MQRPPRGGRCAPRSRSSPAVRCRSSRRRATSPRTAVSVDGRAGWPGRERERRARLADDGRAQQPRVARRPGSASSSSSCASCDQLVVGLRQHRRRAARHQRQVRRVVAEHQPLVEHPLHRAAGQADERLVEDRPIEPEIDGDDRRRRHARARDRATLAQRRRLAVEQLGRARTTARPRSRDRRGHRSSPPATPATRVAAARGSVAVAPVRTVPPWRSMYSRAGSAYIRCSGLRRQRDRRRARIVAEHLGQHAREHAAPPPARGGWLSAASASGSHSISRRRGVWPLRISQFSTVSPGDAAFTVDARRSSRRAFCSGVAMPSTDSRSRHDSASHSKTPATRCNGAGSAGHVSRDPPPRAIDHRHRQLRLRGGRYRCAPMSRRNANVSRVAARAARAGRCRRARRSRDRETRSRGRRAARALRARARARRAASAGRPRSGRRSRRRSTMTSGRFRSTAIVSRRSSPGEVSALVHAGLGDDLDLRRSPRAPP